MKLDIILSGVGGQGILTIATVIGEAALSDGLHIKQAEVHGMSQRGGDVQSNLRISSSPISSDLIPRGMVNAIISLEPMEALRYKPFISKEGWIVTNSAPFVNIPNYPDHGEVMAELQAMPNVIMLDIDAIARENRVERAANIVLLGAASLVLGLESEKLEKAIKTLFERKGESVVEMNLRAFALGREAGKKFVK